MMRVSARAKKNNITTTINSMRAYTRARIPTRPSSCTNMLCQLTCTFMLHQAAAMVTQKDMLHAHLSQCAFRLFTYPVDGSVRISVSKRGLLPERSNAHKKTTGPIAVLNLDRHRAIQNHASGLCMCLCVRACVCSCVMGNLQDPSLC